MHKTMAKRVRSLVAFLHVRIFRCGETEVPVAESGRVAILIYSVTNTRKRIIYCFLQKRPSIRMVKGITGSH